VPCAVKVGAKLAVKFTVKVMAMFANVGVQVRGQLTLLALLRTSVDVFIRQAHKQVHVCVEVQACDQIPLLALLRTRVDIFVMQAHK
jgi:hypothetical protein